MKRKSKINRGGSVISVAALESRVLFNTVITVNTFNDQLDVPGSSTVSLRDALHEAETTGDTTVKLPAGPYTLSLGELKVSSTTGTVTVQPVSGTATINAQSQSRVLEIDSGSKLSVDGVTFFGGYLDSGNGAGISNAGTLTLTNSAVQSNKIGGAGEGGGVYNSGLMNVSNSTIADNSNAVLGGINEGGGLRNIDELTVTNSTISGNTSDYGAGVASDALLAIIGSTVSGNTSYYEGGGVFNTDTTWLTNTTVANNHAEYDGGGVFNNGSLTVTNCTVTGNSAESGDDTTAAEGGGIFTNGSPVAIGNTIVANNTAIAFGNAKAFGPEVFGGFASQGHNLVRQIDNISSSGWNGADLTGTPASPLDPKLQPLDYYGGTEQTELPKATSPAIDAGSNLLAPDGPDERGFDRIVGGTVDIGADEMQLAVSTILPQTVHATTVSAMSLGSFSDPGVTGLFKIEVSWGDGTQDAQFIVGKPGSLGSMNHTYAVSAVYTETVTVVDPNGNADQQGSSVYANVPGSVLSGKVVGTSGSYQNQGNTVNKAFDGNFNTFFDGANSNGNVAGLDLGSAHMITGMAFASRPGFANRMNGGVFEGSNSPTFSSAVPLAIIQGQYANPPAGGFTTIPTDESESFRYVRYVSPTGSYGNVAEIEFIGVLPTKLTGTAIGTTGSYQNQGNTISKAFDGNLSTFFDAPGANGNTVGLDLGFAQRLTQLSFAPRSTFPNRMVGGYFQASNSANFSGAVTLYTISSTPAAGVLTTVTLDVSTLFRYVRYVAPTGSFGNVAEIQFFD